MIGMTYVLLRSLCISNSIRSPYLRQFKDSHIGTLIILSEWKNFVYIENYHGFN